ncbi:hypothetical protein [Motilibacter aurantiacus]|uniref:hypothetical protein n=1 Tax=Motilibacter aurantiacus TaxID=2714955 RepID=UPI00140B9E11|nr:hypothetical protein [Motilibacter aurantiacus]NHC45548.1 hypothetical protein [Motilibacter aurantiacus]
MDDTNTIERLRALSAAGEAEPVPPGLARDVLRRRRRRDAARRVTYGALALAVIAGGSAVWSNSASATPPTAAIERTATVPGDAAAHVPGLALGGTQ